MVDASPAAPAVQSFDPVEWTKRINALESENCRLTNETGSLRAEAALKANEAREAQGALKSLRGEIKLLKEIIEKSENLKELARLRAEVAAMHQVLAAKDKAHVELTGTSAARVEGLSKRAAKAEGKFQALESTAAAMSAARNRAMAQSAEFAAERDLAVEKAKTLEAALSEADRELKTLRMQAAGAKNAPQKK